MEALLEEALQEGFLGLSTMCLKWDKVDGDREWSKSLPSTYARWREVSRLNALLRRYGRDARPNGRGSGILRSSALVRAERGAEPPAPARVPVAVAARGSCGLGPAAGRDTARC